MLISYNWLIANYHQGITPNDKIVIHMPGMPVLAKNTSFSDATIFLAWWFDLIIPEYYGSFRSEWYFSIENCFKTIEETIQICKHWEANDLYSKKNIELKYKTILLYWSSFSAYFVIRLNNYSNIQWIGLASPLLTKPSNNGYPEETIGDVEFELYEKWSKYFYRFDNNEAFHSFFSNLSDSHDDAIRNIWTIPLFVWHGDKDSCIHISRTEHFFQDLQLNGWNNKNRFVPIPWKDHGWSSKWEISTEFVKRSLHLT